MKKSSSDEDSWDPIKPELTTKPTHGSATSSSHTTLTGTGKTLPKTKSPKLSADEARHFVSVTLDTLDVETFLAVKVNRKFTRKGYPIPLEPCNLAVTETLKALHAKTFGEPPSLGDAKNTLLLADKVPLKNRWGDKHAKELADTLYEIGLINTLDRVGVALDKVVTKWDAVHYITALNYGCDDLYIKCDVNAPLKVNVRARIAKVSHPMCGRSSLGHFELSANTKPIRLVGLKRYQSMVKGIKRFMLETVAFQTKDGLTKSVASCKNHPMLYLLKKLKMLLHIIAGRIRAIETLGIKDAQSKLQKAYSARLDTLLRMLLAIPKSNDLAEGAKRTFGRCLKALTVQHPKAKHSIIVLHFSTLFYTGMQLVQILSSYMDPPPRDGVFAIPTSIGMESFEMHNNFYP